MSIYNDIALSFAQDLEERYGKDYTLEDLLRFQAESELITPKTISDYAIKKEYLKILGEQDLKPKEDRISKRAICIQIATKNNRSYEGIYLLTRNL